MTLSSKQPGPFLVRDCALVVLAANLSADDLRSLRDGLLQAETASIYHHFWGRLLQPQFDEPEFNNDFAAWAFHALNDRALAERLSVVDPADFSSLEDLRAQLVDIVEARMEEREVFAFNTASDPFHFTSSQMLIFETPRRATTPAALAELLPQLSPGSVFYHFIDARRREPVAMDDFSAWLSLWGESCQDCIARIGGLDPYFSSLAWTQARLSEICAGLGGSNE